MKVLVTGSAGFIGSTVAGQLLDRGDEVVGVDNLNDYYDPGLKRARLARIEGRGRYTHVHGDLSDRGFVEGLFARHRPERIVHLAAQPGVRYAAVNPHAYIASNITGFLHVLEGCRHHGAEHLVFASTSSVYGANRKMPYSEHHSTEHPLTLYAATKKADEMMAHSYAHLYGIPATGLRFFTVYGPWGRPDMAPMLFARALRTGESIGVFNHGHHSRSFTYIDDIAEGVVRCLDRPANASTSWRGDSPDPASSTAPYRIYNIGHAQPVQLLHFIRLLEQAFGLEAKLEMLPIQPGDVPDTEADTSDLIADTGFTPRVSIDEGVDRFARWHLDHYPDNSRIPRHA